MWRLDQKSWLSLVQTWKKTAMGKVGPRSPAGPFRIPVCGRGAGWLHWLLERRFSCWMEQKRKRLSEVKWKLKKDCAVNTGGSDIWRNLNRFRVVIEQV